MDNGHENEGGQAEALSKKTAQEYVDAANAVISIAELVVPMIPGGGVAVAAAKVVGAAAKARPVINAVGAAAPTVAPLANKAKDAFAQNAPDAINAGVGKVTHAFKGVAEAAGAKKSAVVESAQAARDAREQEKARQLARKALLDGAGIRMSAATFADNWRMQASAASKVGSGYLDYVGCYVVITCDRAVKKGDFSKFREVYVGKSENMGASIHADLNGQGNHDVYADFKYEQDMYVLLYPCTSDRLEELERSLIVALDADGSYNALRERGQWHILRSASRRFGLEGG